MKVQKIRINNQTEDFWIVTGDDHLAIPSIDLYLRYLSSIRKSPNTIRSYAYHLKEFWLFLSLKNYSWNEIGLIEMSEFINFLKLGTVDTSNIIPFSSKVSLRSEKTINTIVTAITAFYDYHSRLGSALALNDKKLSKSKHKSYKPFLHHISKSDFAKHSILKVKEPKRIPKTLTFEQVNKILDSCANRRDKFLVALLYETGMRIGECLGLRHEDIKSWDSTIHVIYRDDNLNNARAKSQETRVIDVSADLIRRYTDYVVYDFDDIDSDYVFVNIWGENKGQPLSYSTVYTKFSRLAKTLNIPFSPHIFRHTHATELLRSGWDASHVQKRLGHKDIQTTINTYAHLNDQDLKTAFQKFKKDQS